MPLAAYFAKKDAENRVRGFTVDYKYLGVALLTELAIVFTSLYGGWLFARRYATDDLTFSMMLLAPIAYAGVELARVPLAFAWRTQSSKFWKVVFALMVLCAAAVTVKSLSQLGEIMFRPRLTAVTETGIALRVARSEQDAAAIKIKAADAIVEQHREELKGAEDRLKQANAAVSGLPKEQCWMVTRRTEQGVTRSRQCKTDARQAPLIANMKDAQAARDHASQAFDRANAERARLSMVDVDTRSDSAEATHRKAVMDSQLHSFTGMFFGKDPTQVTDGEIHFFLRWFVFFPAIFASLAATALALASVNYIKADRRKEAVEIDEEVLRGYVLEPLVDEVERRLAAKAEVDEARVAAKRQVEPSAGAPVEEASPPPSPSNNDNPRFKVVGDAP